MAGNDYVAVKRQSLNFSHGTMRACHTVIILQDSDCKQPPENFFSDLSLVSGVGDILMRLETVEVFIDDALEPECGMYV